MVEPLFLISDFAVFINNNFASLRKVIHREEHRELQKYIQGLMNDYYEHFKQFVTSRENNRRNQGWFLKPSGDWEFANSARHGHSYKKLPPYAPRTKSSLRDGVVAELINDEWVSVPLGSEDFSFKKMRKNPYEDALFKCEDERYELDMIIESTITTIGFLEKIQANIESMSIE
jgi:paired amphipathic helix protein Sin3a